MQPQSGFAVHSLFLPINHCPFDKLTIVIGRPVFFLSTFVRLFLRDFLLLLQSILPSALSWPGSAVTAVGHLFSVLFLRTLRRVCVSPRHTGYSNVTKWILDGGTPLTSRQLDADGWFVAIRRPTDITYKLFASAQEKTGWRAPCYST